jgi:hypothetical protein
MGFSLTGLREDLWRHFQDVQMVNDQ